MNFGPVYFFQVQEIEHSFNGAQTRFKPHNPIILFLIEIVLYLVHQQFRERSLQLYLNKGQTKRQYSTHNYYEAFLHKSFAVTYV